MVLPAASTSKILSGRGLPNGPTIDVRINIFGTLLFCKACEAKLMASIPPSAFSASRIRESQRELKVSNVKKASENEKFFSTRFTELSPMKYNSKLMNSIWGIYNRYSPHNVKKINDAHTSLGELQQSAANSPNKSDPIITLPTAKFEKFWATL